MTARGRESRTAVIAGATGIVGGNLVDHLLAGDWTVYGVARRTDPARPRLLAVGADLTDAGATRRALAPVKATHAFYCTWSRQATEAENCTVNRAMLENFLDSLDPEPLRHVVLVTGTKHYYQRATGLVCETPFREDEPRLRIENFYYVLEDVLIDRAARRGFSWSIHRPGTVIGYALGNQMNLGVTLAIYGSLCREAGLPFRFPGSPQVWSGLSQITDAALLARHIAWAAQTDDARNEAFNVANGDLFRWRWLWPKLAAEFGVDAVPGGETPRPLAAEMNDAGRLWKGMIDKYSLRPIAVSEVAAWWHVDGDLGRQFEAIADLSKGARLGFCDTTDTLASFSSLFDRLRRERVIPRFQGR